MVRFDRGAESDWEMSWIVAPQFRKMGIGKMLVAEGLKLVKGTITARIKAENHVSIRVAELAGFKLLRRDNSVLLYGWD